MEIVKLLLEYKADLYWDDSQGNTPLDSAIRCLGDKKDNLLQLLKSAGLDINYENEFALDYKKKGTALSKAIERADDDGVSTLLKHNASVHKRARGQTPLQIAAKSKNVTAAKLLLDAKARVDYVVDDFPKITRSVPTPLHIAVETGQREMVDLLLERKANPNSYDKSHTPLLTAALENSTSLISCLLEHGANPFMANDSPYDTPLHVWRKEAVETVKQSSAFAVNTERLWGVGLFSDKPNEKIIPVVSRPFARRMEDNKFYKHDRGSKGMRVYWLENNHQCLRDFSKTEIAEIARDHGLYKPG